LDMQTFIYMSNFSKAMRRCGEVWLSMAKDLYVEDERKMKVIDVTDTVDSITLMTPAISEIGEVITENDLSKASFDVDVDVGPSSSSKRSATVRALTVRS
jgi:thymidine phosphorylase